MFDDTVDAIKKYWPWALGVVAVGYLVLRGGGSGGSTDSGVIMYDPNLLDAETQRLGMQLQSDVEIATAAIQANAQVETAQLAAVAAGFQSLATINDSFVVGNIATYQAIKEQSIAAVNAGAEVASSSLIAGGMAQQAFNKTVGDLGIATGQIVTAVGQANAASSGGFGSFASSAMKFAAFF